MLDVIGVTQHHDAITGTSLKNIAKDYKDKVYNATIAMMPIYASLIEREASTKGVKAAWKPMGLFEGLGDEYQVRPEKLANYFAVHNPTDSILQIVRIPVQDANIKAELVEADKSQALESDVVCEPVIQGQSNNVRSADPFLIECSLYVQANVPPQGISIIKISPHSTTAQQTKASLNSKNGAIESTDLVVSFDSS
jgi:hypothetical protein